MKIKLILMLVLVSLISTIIPCGSCLAAEPEVTREYISRKIGGEKSSEEKLSVDYKNLRIEQGCYLIVSFLDNYGLKLKEYEFDMASDELSENKLSFGNDKLQGVKYVEVGIVASGCEYSGIKLPFEIK